MPAISDEANTELWNYMVEAGIDIYHVKKNPNKAIIDLLHMVMYCLDHARTIGCIEGREYGNARKGSPRFANFEQLNGELQDWLSDLYFAVKRPLPNQRKNGLQH